MGSKPTLVIAECANTWRFGSDELANACRLIESVKQCGADAAKFQWTSDPALMAERRHGKREEFEILAWPAEWMPKLKEHCDKAGIEFMCTVFLAKDIPVVALLVKRFKVASAESSDRAFTERLFDGRPVYVSHAFGERPAYNHKNVFSLACVCAYPTPIEQANLRRIASDGFDGYSDHTTSVLTGALCVAAGGTIVEKHVRLMETPYENPDFPHSLVANCNCGSFDNGECTACFRKYTENIREAELAMGNGRNEVQECEKPFESRRVK